MKISLTRRPRIVWAAILLALLALGVTVLVAVSPFGQVHADSGADIEPLPRVEQGVV